MSYFRKSFDLDAETDECTFTVQTFSTNVCQMRVDFEKFQFSSSEDVLLGLDLLVRKQDCKRDYMSITPQNYNLPRKFCGNNDGQHGMYKLIDVNILLRLNCYSIYTFAFKQRSTIPYQFSKPRWNFFFERRRLAVKNNTIGMSRISRFFQQIQKYRRSFRF